MNEAIDRLALLLSRNPGLRIRPKSDGRVEIPRHIVRIMGWHDEKTIWIRAKEGRLILSGTSGTPENAWLVAGTAVSMGRVRIPLHALKKAGMDGSDLVMVAEENRVVVLPDKRAFEKHMRVVFGTLAKLLPKGFSFDALADLIGGRQSAKDIAGLLFKLFNGTEIEHEAAEDIQPMTATVEIAVPELEEEEPVDPPTLFLPEPARPLVMRILGNPYQFNTHWMRGPFKKHSMQPWPGSAGLADNHTRNENELGLCGPLCTVCERRKADRMWLVPVLASEAGMRRAGYLMVQAAAIRKIARALQDKDRDRTDVILFHKAWSEGMCDVYVNPPEELPKEELEKGRRICGSPDRFLADAFREARHIGGDPVRPPMMITGHHLEWVPVAPAASFDEKAESYTEETELDSIVDAIETGRL